MLIIYYKVGLSTCDDCKADFIVYKDYKADFIVQIDYKSDFTVSLYDDHKASCKLARQSRVRSVGGLDNHHIL